MSQRSRLLGVVRTASTRHLQEIRRQSYHQLTAHGLLKQPSDLRLARRRPWPMGTFSLHHVPAVRNASFYRILPKLATKLLRIPAMFGGAAIAGLAYVQYQATQAGNYAMDIFRQASDQASIATSSMMGGIKDIADQTRLGWQRTKEAAPADMELPSWLRSILRGPESKEQKTSDNAEAPSQSKSTAGAMAIGGLSYANVPGDEEEEAARDDQMMVLTKKMIEIRSLLQTIGQSNALTLPSIVVIGSQSSGKSSVLEALVGHEFLPKGSNMVTRRPIELTLVNTSATIEYGEFPELGLGKMTDFSHIRQTLTDLNLAVPAEQCVSDDPIQLSIYSPHVPDLSLIDLPGYIQVVGMDQPLELKQKISDLCDKYIQPPNVILAISAADVDLANSTALRASRRVDPRGERTIGVVTKMDLVDAHRGVSILSDTRYPLRLGYVGVVSRVPEAKGLFSRSDARIATAISKNEHAYFSSHPLEFGPESELAVGTGTLRKKLMHVLEQTMAASLQGTSDAIRQELEEATYEFKVQYNDRPLSAESYLAESLDSFKRSFKEFAESFGRTQVRDLLKQELDQRVLDILAQRYWNKPIADLQPMVPEPDPLSALPTADAESGFWHRKLDASSSALTKLGVGRVATTVVANALQSRIDGLIANSTFSAHPFARDAIANASSSILNERFYSTSDQVENCIKPYKFEIEVEDSEWIKSRHNAAAILKHELQACTAAERAMQESVGGKRKLQDVMSFIDRARRGDLVLEGDGSGGAGGFSAALLQKGREAVFLRDRANILDMRLRATKSKQCSRNSSKYYCPEIFLDVVADKLTSTAVLFLNVELLSEFYYNFPRELDLRLGRHLSPSEVEQFAREDPKIRNHLDVIKRQEMLQLVLDKMDSLKTLESTQKREERNNLRGSTNPKGKWSLF